jgi:hypothetical protein
MTIEKGADVFTRLTRYPSQMQRRANAKILWENPMCLNYLPTLDETPVLPVTLEFKSIVPEFELLFWKFTQ